MHPADLLSLLWVDSASLSVISSTRSFSQEFPYTPGGPSSQRSPQSEHALHVPAAQNQRGMARQGQVSSPTNSDECGTLAGAREDAA